MTCPHRRLVDDYGRVRDQCPDCGRNPLPWWAKIHQRYLIGRYVRHGWHR